MTISPCRLLATLSLLAVMSAPAVAADSSSAVSDDVIAAQRAALAAATDGQGYGPQSPRDITAQEGGNGRNFSNAPDLTKLALCDIHFHDGAEHKGGNFSTYAGNGDGQGFGTGFRYDGKLTEAELAPLDSKVGASKHGDLEPGDTIEIHFAYSTAKATVGNGLGTCFSKAINNPQLRVEAVIAVLVNDPDAADFTKITKIEVINGLNQAPYLPDDLGEPIIYEGSTTGPGFNRKGSPFQVTWGVRPEVLKVDINSLARWLADNPFDEKYAHGVRNLVTNPDLLSPIN